MPNEQFFLGRCNILTVTYAFRVRISQLKHRFKGVFTIEKTELRFQKHWGEKRRLVQTPGVHLELTFKNPYFQTQPRSATVGLYNSGVRQLHPPGQRTQRRLQSVS